jgi:RNA polymerase sigma-70 factor (ECF subfamily)
MQKDDRQLQRTIRAAQAGDEQAFEALLGALEQQVYRLAYSMLRSREDAEDATQETLIKLWRTLPSYRFECPILPYTLHMARNVALDALRRRASRVQSVSLTSEDEAGESEQWDIADPDEYADPARDYERGERIRGVRAAIDELPPEHKEILTLKDIEGYSYEQIGQILQLEQGTVKSRLSRARKNLAEILKARNIF